jgi:hypothetical protein
MSCPYGYKYLMGINMRRPYGIYGSFQNKLWQDKTQRKKQKAGQGDMIDTWDLKKVKKKVPRIVKHPVEKRPLNDYWTVAIFSRSGHKHVNKKVKKFAQART